MRRSPPEFDARQTIEYLIVVPVRFHRLDGASVAAESAFCEHLRSLRRNLAPKFTHLTVAAPTFAANQYERDRGHLGVIDEEREGIRWVALHPGDSSRVAFWLRHSLGVARSLWREVRRADLVHSGTSHDVFRPFEFTALVLAKSFGKKSVCVVDIDLRDEARMNRRTGRLGRKSYLLCRAVYEPLRRIQMRAAVRWCSLVLLKGKRLCRDYGSAREHVKYFLDAAFASDDLIPPEALKRKIGELADGARPLELVYFGRLTAYKGVDRCIQAVALASKLTSSPLRLSIIGSGEEAASLAQLRDRLAMQARIEFRAAVPFGPQLFELVRPMHLLLAAPSTEDTPRSALDALASGVPILAFDTEYYADLAESGTVELVPWPSVIRLAECIARCADDKSSLAARMSAAVEFAGANSQEIWLRRRAQWTLALFEPSVGAQDRTDGRRAWQRTI